MDTDALSQSQKDALSQLQTLTNGGDVEVAKSVLESVDWDVQRAAEVIFDNVLPASSPATTMDSNVETFELDDSEQGLFGEHRAGREFRPVDGGFSSALIIRPIRAIITILAIPLYPLFSLIRFILRFLRIPLPNFAPFTLSSLTFPYRSLATGPGRESKAMDPRSVAERWVRELEEETGAVCIGRGHRSRSTGVLAENGNGHGVSSGANASAPGPSMLTARPGAWDPDGHDGEVKFLPDFFLGSYEDFARTCQRDATIGCVILVSEEHDDVAEFKRSTLTDPTFVQLIQDNGILVWGGDIRDRDTWSASQKLQATTYPFVTFIALQPRRAPATANAPAPMLTVLSRHQGPAIPSTSAPTAAQTLTTHLNEQLLPRVTAFLIRVRAQASERERERALRAEQDRAFEQSRKRDKERAEQRAREERLAQEVLRRAVEAEARAIEEQRVKETEARAWQAHRMEWRRWVRRGLMMREPRPGETGRGKTMRVGVRMPDGKRSVRFFGEGDGITALYAYVDSLFIAPEFMQDADPREPPNGNAAGDEGLLAEMEKSGRTPEKWWGFKLVLAYPRKDISWEAEKRLGDVEALKGGGQVVVELVPDSVDVKGKQKQTKVDVDVDSDGYHTEESE
ncbi:UBX domain-containing protein 3 [Grifola frondosa]|uniref:UBX domain-containing protein 3 n=1 Tax=Grifola frondosa TaxID=5627 RepID=A0A1C7MRH6_GRIFR|nr:UBX domain-containing protein 3 [Grifola frondosa]